MRPETGMHCMTLLAGEPPNETTDNYTCLAIHVGESIDAELSTFGTFDLVVFEKNVVGHFLEFVQSTSEQTRLSAAQRVATIANPLPTCVQIVDPYESERQDNAKQAAAEENSKRKDQKKDKDKKKKKKRTLASGEEVEGLAEPATTTTSSPE
ncbi:hypothetical protein PsYK624_170040 [Phanerochaete sordida]|uniref:Uncharacterized protein n=1 Tax=Phanerochaete sordida TaxID=48140 RepID=A0A9P3LMS6_9APHY|nr:hypothetical protein PsYK624_170040 [Phanerochaete sordida]